MLVDEIKQLKERQKEKEKEARRLWREWARLIENYVTVQVLPDGITRITYEDGTYIDTDIRTRLVSLIYDDMIIMERERAEEDFRELREKQKRQKWNRKITSRSRSSKYLHEMTL